MTAPTRPASTKAFGTEKFSFVATIATITAPSLATEINAAGSLDVSCYLFDSSDRPTQNTNRITRERRVCDTVQFEQIGITTMQGGNLMYALDPQAAAGATGKKAWEKFVAGATGFLVRRAGIDVNTDYAAGQFVDVIPIEVGPHFDVKVGDGESAEWAGTNAFAITGPIATNVAIAA